MNGFKAGLNLYERNLYKYFEKNQFFGILSQELREFLSLVSAKMERKVFHDIYLNYIEIPITTICSLRCRECANLIQYYECGKFYDYKEIIRDVRRLCQIARGIEQLRILGGEPLLHSHLQEILEGILKNDNINSIQVVTNGTLLFNDNILPVLRNKRISVEVSNYGDVSRKYDALIRQLRRNHIIFYTHKELKWTKQADFAFQNKTSKELEMVLHQCRVDCISMLDGEIHLCPRSSNGSDLGIFKADKGDFVNIRERIAKKRMKQELFRLLNRESIVACNYCKVYMWESLPPCVAGEQIGKREAAERYHNTLRANKDSRR